MPLALGILLNMLGETDQAETWWRRAADAGHPSAPQNLKALLY
ncbi:hypothetical protein [Nocardia gipuzkoensis]